MRVEWACHLALRNPAAQLGGWGWGGGLGVTPEEEGVWGIGGVLTACVCVCD